MELVLNSLWPRGLRHGAKDVGQSFVGQRLLLIGSMKQCNVPKKDGPHGEFFFLAEERAVDPQ